MKITTTDKLRATLAAAMERAMDGKLPESDGRNIIGLANQISQSMAVEVKVLTMKNSLSAKQEAFGSLNVGDAA